MNVEHTCFVCGAMFSTCGSLRKCPSCRKPKLRGVVRRVNHTLSPREKQIVALVCEAKENKELAYELRLTEGTVKTYLSRIFVKTGAVNRVDLAVRSVTGRL